MVLIVLRLQLDEAADSSARRVQYITTFALHRNKEARRYECVQRGGVACKWRVLNVVASFGVLRES